MSAKRASGLTLARARTSVTATPSHRLSNRLQRVTQCISATTTFWGRRLNSSQVNRTGFSTSPLTVKSHFAASKRGTAPYCKTGHLSVSDCPGGSRSESCICRSSCFRSLVSPKSICTSYFMKYADQLIYVHLEAADPPCCEVIDESANGREDSSYHAVADWEEYYRANTHERAEHWHRARAARRRHCSSQYQSKQTHESPDY